MRNTVPLKRRLPASVLLVALGLQASAAQAEIRLDRVYEWVTDKAGWRKKWDRPEDLDVPTPRSVEESRALTRMQRAFRSAGGEAPVLAAINRDQVAQGFEEGSSESINIFHMTWNGGSYYVAGLQYRSKEQNAYRDAAMERGGHSKPIPGGGVCALFVYDDMLRPLASQPVRLEEAGGRTWCNGANALGRAPGEDALLFSISYYLTDEPLASRPEDIGDDWRYMTVLLRLKQHDGRVLVEQDDTCLGNPNTHKDIASARKALAACAATDRPAK